MCGIAGHLARVDARADVAAIDRMNVAQRHRSPDAVGTWHDGPVALGHGRLAIIDLREVAKQPMTNETGDVVIVVNGELYNHVELRAELEAKGHVFRSRSDSEVVAHLWEEHGADLVPRLRGMFALAVWDKRTRQLLLARDRYGEKPLHWTMGPHGLVFASELRALMASGMVPGEIDPVALDAYLALQYVPQPLTIYQGVHKLPPGYFMLVRPGEEPRQPEPPRHHRVHHGRRPLHRPPPSSPESPPRAAASSSTSLRSTA